jgi:hypothetical protein
MKMVWQAVSLVPLVKRQQPRIDNPGLLFSAFENRQADLAGLPTPTD